MKAKVGDIVLRAGDTLLILTERSFMKRWETTNDFYMITPLGDEPDVADTSKGPIAIITLLGMLLLAATNVLSMFKAALLAVLVLTLTRTVTLDGVKKYVHFQVLLLIACAIGVGTAVDQTGAATFVADHLVSFTQSFGILGVDHLNLD